MPTGGLGVLRTGAAVQPCAWAPALVFCGWTCFSARDPGVLGLRCLGIREGVRPGEAELFEYRAPRSWSLWGVRRMGRATASPELLVAWPPKGSALLRWCS